MVGKLERRLISKDGKLWNYLLNLSEKLTIQLFFNCYDFTDLVPQLYFSTPWNHQNTSGFLMFSGFRDFRERPLAWNGLTADVFILLCLIGSMYHLNSQVFLSLTLLFLWKHTSSYSHFTSNLGEKYPWLVFLCIFWYLIEHCNGVLIKKKK